MTPEIRLFAAWRSGACRLDVYDMPNDFAEIVLAMSHEYGSKAQ